MTGIQKLRRMLHVERAHRMQLESNIEILRSLLTSSDEPALSTSENLVHLLDAVLVTGREARHLDKRYHAVIRDNAGSVAAVKPEDIPALIDQAELRYLFGFDDWLSEQRPDLKRVIRGVRVGEDPERESFRRG